MEGISILLCKGGVLENYYIQNKVCGRRIERISNPSPLDMSSRLTQSSIFLKRDGNLSNAI